MEWGIPGAGGQWGKFMLCNNIINKIYVVKKEVMKALLYWTSNSNP